MVGPKPAPVLHVDRERVPVFADTCHQVSLLLPFRGVVADKAQHLRTPKFGKLRHRGAALDAFARACALSEVRIQGPTPVQVACHLRAERIKEAAPGSVLVLSDGHDS